MVVKKVLLGLQTFFQDSMSHDIKTKQKVFGLKGSEYEGVEYCDPEHLLDSESGESKEDKKDYAPEKRD